MVTVEDDDGFVGVGAAERDSRLVANSHPDVAGPGVHHVAVQLCDPVDERLCLLAVDGFAQFELQVWHTGTSQASVVVVGLTGSVLDQAVDSSIRDASRLFRPRFWASGPPRAGGSRARPEPEKGG